MTKEELITRLAATTEVEPQAIEHLLSELATIAWEQVDDELGFVIPGFGNVRRRRTEARSGLNPATGELIALPSREVIRAQLLSAEMVRGLREATSSQPFGELTEGVNDSTPSDRANPVEPFSVIRERLEALAEKLRSSAAASVELEVAAPADPKRLRYLEQKFSFTLPNDFRQYLVEGSAELHFSWLFAERTWPQELRQFKCGDGIWSLETLEEGIEYLDPLLRRAERELLSLLSAHLRPKQIGTLLRHTLLPFHRLINGDLVCLDCFDGPLSGRVVLYEHERGFDPFAPQMLAASFGELVTAWSKMAVLDIDNHREDFSDLIHGRNRHQVWRKWLMGSSA